MLVKALQPGRLALAAIGGHRPSHVPIIPEPRSNSTHGKARNLACSTALSNRPPDEKTRFVRRGSL